MDLSNELILISLLFYCFYKQTTSKQVPNLSPLESYAKDLNFEFHMFMFIIYDTM